MQSHSPDDEIQRLRTLLQRSEEETLRFLDGAVHDLRSAQRAIANSAEVLLSAQSSGLDGEARETLRELRAGVGKMNAVLNGIDGYAMSAAASRYSFKPIPAELALRSALAGLGREIGETGATVTHGTLPNVVGDLERLTSVFRILIGNALTYRSAAPPRVHVQATRNPRDCLLSVEDNGVGIDPKYWDRLFIPFRRLQGAEIPGVGLGLSICKKILDAHHGNIWLESEPGRGTTFFFTLPTQARDSS